MSAADDQPLEGNDREGTDAGSRQPPGWMRAVRRYGPFAGVAVLVVVAIVLFRGGDDDDSVAVEEAPTDREELVRSGPMTPERAELVGEEVDFGPGCDSETGRIMLPTVYAPPCVEPFTGDNGGATGTGVTDDAIKVVLYVPRDDFFAAMLDVGGELDAGVAGDVVQDYIELYSQVFETYGRQVELEVFSGQGEADDAAQAQADAIAIAEVEPFAVIGGPFVANANQAFADELAARGVICLPGCGGTGLADSFVTERAPFVWVDGMTVSQSGQIAGEAIGTLAGPDDPATLAGDPDLHEEERVYGVLYPEGSDEMFPALRDGLAEHGIEVAVDIEYSLDVTRVQEDTRNHIVRLQDAGVTTVIVTGAPFTPGFLTNEATEQDYFPEWVLGPNFFADTRLFTQRTDENQWVNGFGIGYKLAATGTAGQVPELYEWGYGEEPEDVTAMPYLEPSTRMLFTGLHLAGPELDPASFRDGLFRFPPSGDGITSATTSWGDQDIWPETDYGTEDDVAIIWWDPAATGHPDRDFVDEDDVGFYRMAADGQRYRPGELPGPDDAGLFEDGSSVLMYGAPLPPEDEELFDHYPPPDISG